MANKRITALTEELTPATSDVVAIDGATTRKTTIVALVDAARPFATQAEAEGGAGTTQTMNPLASKQLIDYERTQARSFTGIQTFTTTSAAIALIRVESSDEGTTQGPFIDLARTSASPAANDALGGIRFRGMDSGANETSFVVMRGKIIDPTDTSEDAALEIVASVGGVQTQTASFSNGFVVGAATGSYQGTGTVNATGYYLNGSALASTLFGVTPGATGLALLDDADAATARTTLGLGTMATQAASAVAITGGSVAGITDLAVADGGTGSSTASGARTNLGAAAIAANTFTAAQTVTPVALTDGATITPNLTLSNHFTLTLGGNRAMANPSSKTVGTSFLIVIAQDATGSRTLTWGTDYEFPGGIAPTLTTTASGVDMISGYVYSSTRILCNIVKAFA